MKNNNNEIDWRDLGIVYAIVETVLRIIGGL